MIAAIIAVCAPGACSGRPTAGHRGSMSGSSNQVEFYPDLGYVLVVLGNTDGGAEPIAAHVRDLLTSSRR